MKESKTCPAIFVCVCCLETYQKINLFSSFFSIDICFVSEVNDKETSIKTQREFPLWQVSSWPQSRKYRDCDQSWCERTADHKGLCSPLRRSFVLWPPAMLTVLTPVQMRTETTETTEIFAGYELCKLVDLSLLASQVGSVTNLITESISSLHLWLLVIILWCLLEWVTVDPPRTILSTLFSWAQNGIFHTWRDMSK